MRVAASQPTVSRRAGSVLLLMDLAPPIKLEPVLAVAGDDGGGGGASHQLPATSAHGQLQQPTQLLAPAPAELLPRPASSAVVLRRVDDSEGGGGEDEDGDAGGLYRKRGRPRKYEGLDEEERRKRRMYACDPSRPCQALQVLYSPRVVPRFPRLAPRRRNPHSLLPPVLLVLMAMVVRAGKTTGRVRNGATTARSVE